MPDTIKVTDFSLEDANGQQVKVVDLIKALNHHCKKEELEGESFSCPFEWDAEKKDIQIPERYRWLVAYAVEGESEAWYVHVGAMIRPESPVSNFDNYSYMDFGFAKVWSKEVAFAVAREVQRFLWAARWN